MIHLYYPAFWLCLSLSLVSPFIGRKSKLRRLNKTPEKKARFSQLPCLCEAFCASLRQFRNRRRSRLSFDHVFAWFKDESTFVAVSIGKKYRCHSAGKILLPSARKKYRCRYRLCCVALRVSSHFIEHSRNGGDEIPRMEQHNHCANDNPDQNCQLNWSIFE